MKKGEITLFVILGIVIITVLVLAFSYRYALFGEAKGTILSASAKEIKKDMEDCMNIVGIESIYWTGLHGGYSLPPLKALNIGNEFIPYYYYEGRNIMPKLSMMENEISVHAKSVLSNCLLFIDTKGFEVIYPEKWDVSAKVKPRSVEMRMRYPVSFVKDQTEFKLSELYTKEYPVRLDEIYRFVQGIVEKEVNGDYYVDYTYLSEHRFNVTISMHENRSLLYIVEDPESVVEGNVYAFAFANKFA